MRIREFAQLTGVSVRTLHYYDEIGLLKPSFIEEHNSYRFYDEHSLSRMQEILFFRELDFPLKDIVDILSSPDYDKMAALAGQKHLLTLRKERIERLISALDSAMKGETITMTAFDNSEFLEKRSQYAKEAKEKWGDTAAYKESAEKTKGYSKEKWSELTSDMEDIMAEFALCNQNGTAPDSEEAQVLVRKWQDFITANYYTCTDEILAGLGEMYISDEKFRTNIDSHGNGTAAFMYEAIKYYCS